MRRTFGVIYNNRRRGWNGNGRIQKDTLHAFSLWPDVTLMRHVMVVRQRKQIKYSMKRWRWVDGDFFALRTRPEWPR